MHHLVFLTLAVDWIIAGKLCPFMPVPYAWGRMFRIVAPGLPTVLAPDYYRHSALSVSEGYVPASFANFVRTLLSNGGACFGFMWHFF